MHHDRSRVPTYSFYPASYTPLCPLRGAFPTVPDGAYEAPMGRLLRRLWGAYGAPMGTPILILSDSDGTTTRLLFTTESYTTLGTALWGPSLTSKTAPMRRL